MPSRRSSSDSVKPRRGRQRNETPSSKSSSKKVNGSTNSKKKDKEEKEEVDSDDKIDLSSETSCRLCDNKKEFKPNTDALAKHYALAHFKTSLEGEIKGGDNVCNICKEGFTFSIKYCSVKVSKPKCSFSVESPLHGGGGNIVINS